MDQLSAITTDGRSLLVRVRFLAYVSLTFFLITWLYAFWPFDRTVDRFNNPLFGDFPQFYIFGQMLRDAPAELYNLAEQQRRLHQLLPDLDSSKALPFWYPVLTGLPFLPLSYFSYTLAGGFFALCSLVAIIGSAQLLRAKLNWLKELTWFQGVTIICGLPVVLEALFGGQLSLFGLFFTCGVIYSILTRRYVIAGVFLALACYKPNFLIFFSFGILLRFPRALIGFLPTLVFGGILSWLAVGSLVMQN